MEWLQDDNKSTEEAVNGQCLHNNLKIEQSEQLNNSPEERRNGEATTECNNDYVLLNLDHFLSPTRIDNDTIEKNESMQESPQKKTTRPKNKFDKAKLAKEMRNQGKAYVRPKTGEWVPQRELQPRCNSDQCAKHGRGCSLFDDEQRAKIFEEFFKMGDLTRQRDFIVRHVRSDPTKRQSSKSASRRLVTNSYFLTNSDRRQHLVCKVLFLNTLGISERMMRTALSKVNSSGIVEGEKRGGKKSAAIVERQKRVRETIRKHIESYPKVKACSSNGKQFLHSELTVVKMHEAFVQQQLPDDANIANDSKPCIDLYRKIFRSMNYTFDRQKSKKK